MSFGSPFGVDRRGHAAWPVSRRVSREDPANPMSRYMARRRPEDLRRHGLRTAATSTDASVGRCRRRGRSEASRQCREFGPNTGKFFVTFLVDDDRISRRGRARLAALAREWFETGDCPHRREWRVHLRGRNSGVIRRGRPEGRALRSQEAIARLAGVSRSKSLCRRASLRPRR